MSTSCPIGLDVARLREEVRLMYERVAEDPSGDFHFHRGPAYAARRLGYDADALARLPSEITASFAGVANPHLAAAIREGEVVLDIGSGAGTDLLLAARAVGSTGRAVGVDMTDGMIAKARAGAAAMGFAHVEVRKGDLHALPVADGEVDVVISNGVLNLAPDKIVAFREIVRVLKPGGRLQLGDILLDRELSEGTRSDIDLWTG